MRNKRIGNLQQISKISAKKRFAEGKTFFILHADLIPGPPSNLEHRLDVDAIDEWKRRAARYAPDGETPSSLVWKGDIPETAWELWTTFRYANKVKYYKPIEG